MTSRGLVQFVDRSPLIDLGCGHPDPVLLPTTEIQRAVTSAAATYGGSFLEYGFAAGPSPLVEWVVEHVARTDGRRPTADEVVITAGSSWALDHLASLVVKPSSTVLVESPTYHLALKILRDHAVDVVAVPTDEEGLIVDEVAAITRRSKGAGKPPPVLYTIPTFGNPTGACLGIDRRMALVRLAADEGILIIEDDAYRELSYDGAPPPSLWSLAPPETVIRLQSLSKTLAPGLRVGYLTAGPKMTHRITDSGVLDSGGGISHFAAVAVAEYMRAGQYEAHVQRLRVEYGQRRDALLAGLLTAMPDLEMRRPRGGYFLWGSLPDRLDSAAFVASAERAGVGFIPGRTFHVDGGSHSTLRLSFSRFGPETLGEAAERLGAAFRAFRAT